MHKWSTNESEDEKNYREGDFDSGGDRSTLPDRQDRSSQSCELYSALRYPLRDPRSCQGCSMGCPHDARAR